MTLLDNHLEQISLSSAAIAELPHKPRFPPPKIFTNAFLNSHDITALIRDTEPHERALFTLAPPDQLAGVPDANLPRRSTLHNNTNGPPLGRTQRQGSAVATLLGGELGEQIRNEGSKEGKGRGEVDVNLLLKGAEKLCSVYPIAGAPERIAALRSRYEQLNVSVMRFEARVAKQNAQLSKMNMHKDGDGEHNEDEEAEDEDGDEPMAEPQVTEEDLRIEQEMIEELEKRKKVLEDRVSGMERDLGGLLR
ncbi:MAG: hypothetical protein Q9164_003277 [Protoblastenia rupestris]